MQRRPGASLFNVPRLPEKELKDDAVVDAMGVDNLDELQAWVDGLLEDRDGDDIKGGAASRPTGPTPATAAANTPTLKAPGQAAATPNLSALAQAWDSALSGGREAAPVNGVKPAAALHGPGAAVAEGTAVPGGGNFAPGEAVLHVSATDLKILQVPMGCYFAYPGRALEGYPMFAIVPPAQHAHLAHQLQVLLRMQQIMHISGLSGNAEPVQQRVLHHVIIPSSHLGQPPMTLAMESLFTLVLTNDDQPTTVLIQSRPCVE